MPTVGDNLLNDQPVAKENDNGDTSDGEVNSAGELEVAVAASTVVKTDGAMSPTERQ